MAPSSREQLRSPVRYRAQVLTLACMLVLANLALALHHYDLDAHQAHHTCEVCVSASGLDHALTPGLAELPAASAESFLAPVGGNAHTPHATTRYHARAPPV